MLFEFIVRRLVFAFIAMVCLLVLVFIMARLTGDPALLYLPETASEEMREQFREIHGLNDPVYVQLFNYLVSSAQLDFGMSLRRNIPAMEAVMQAFPWTLRLAGTTVVLAMLVAFLVGPLAAYRPVRSSTVSPACCRWPPPAPRISGWQSSASCSSRCNWASCPPRAPGGPEYWILPIGVLMFKITGTTTQVIRGAMITSLASTYVKSARAKGMPERRIIFIHALRNSIISAVTVAGDQTRGLINGAVIVETIFGWPGVGKLMIDSIVQRDFAVLQATVIVTAASIFLLNIFIDVLYTFLDPRIEV